MAKKKRKDEDTGDEGGKEDGRDESTEPDGAVKPIILGLKGANKFIFAADTPQGIWDGEITIPHVAAAYGLEKGSGSIKLSNYTIPTISLPSEREWAFESNATQLQEERWELKRELAEKAKVVREKGLRIEELTATVERLNANWEKVNKEQKVRDLRQRVNESARKRLLESDELFDLFENERTCDAVVMSVDIRRSTELMLKARKPQFFAEFISELCSKVTKIILDSYGVFEKFTGDGILAFFPKFYSGDDAAYWAVKAAAECHDCFVKHYRDHRSHFNSVLKEIGLGIGIDYGKCHLMKMQGGLNVIGTPVVYACRMAGAQAGQTLLNQPAYEITSDGYGQYVDFQETEIPIKHEGPTIAYLATLNRKKYSPKLPKWEEPADVA